MKKLITLRSFVASIVMMLTATVVLNAQTAADPWHVIVYDESDKEVATHSIEIIEDVVATAQNVTFLLTTGATYDYPIASMFGFDQRKGNGTAIEAIAAPKWNVHYSNGSLHFTEAVNSVAVYSVYGTLVKKFVGSRHPGDRVSVISRFIKF